jgi:hypothetical protein
MLETTLRSINQASSGRSTTSTDLKGLTSNVGRLDPEWRDRIVYCVAIPIMIALVSALRGSAFNPDLPNWRLAVMCVSLGIPTWIVACLAKNAISKVIDQSGPFNALTVGIPGLIALVFNYFLLSAELTFFGSFFYGFEALVSKNGFGLADSLGTYLVGPSAAYFLFFWFGANALQAIITRYQAPTRIAGGVVEAKAEKKVTPKFFEKLSPRCRQGLVAVHAQEHYMLVMTRFGSELIHYRFGEAVKELNQFCRGLQVHRSFWVSTDGVAEVARTDRSYKLVLVTGHEAFENSGISVCHEAA